MQRATIFDRLRKRRKLFVGALRGKGGICVSLKGLALLCAIDAGMILPDSDGNYDDGPFSRFWDEFSKFIRADRSGYPNEMQDAIEFLQEEKGMPRK